MHTHTHTGSRLEELEFEKFEILGVDTAARRAGEDLVSLESAM